MKYFLIQLNKYQLILWPVFALFTIVFLIAFVMFPQVNGVIKERQMLAEMSKKVNLLENKAKDLERIDEPVTRQNLSTALSILPADRDLISALSQVQSLAAANSISLEDIGFSSSTQGAGKDSDAVVVSVQTGSVSVDQLKSLFTHLKYAPRLMVLDSVELAKGKSSGVYQASLFFKTFYQNIPVSIGNLEDPLGIITEREEEILQTAAQSLRAIPIVTPDNVSGKRGKSDPFN